MSKSKRLFKCYVSMPSHAHPGMRVPVLRAEHLVPAGVAGWTTILDLVRRLKAYFSEHEGWAVRFETRLVS